MSDIRKKIEAMIAEVEDQIERLQRAVAEVRGELARLDKRGGQGMSTEIEELRRVSEQFRVREDENDHLSCRGRERLRLTPDD
jgi:ferritin-like metal-binding protein YciE